MNKNSEESFNVTGDTAKSTGASFPADSENLHHAGDIVEANLNLKPASGNLLTTAALTLAIGLMVGYFFGRPPHVNAVPVESTDKPAVPDSADIVKLTETQATSIRLDSAVMRSFRSQRVTTGKIAYNEDNTTSVFSPYTGRITRLLVKPGDEVKKGDTLFEIDTPDVVQAESDLVTAASTLKKSESALHLAQRSELIAKHNIESSERNLELSKKNEQRQKELFEDKASSLKDWEAAQQATQQAQKDLEQGQKDYEQSQSDIKSAESDMLSNETVLKATRDRLITFGKTVEEIQKNESNRTIDRNTRVVAPISGTITQRKVGAGQYVRPDSSDPLFVISDLSVMWMFADAYESDAELLKAGLSVEVTLLAYPEKFNAVISHIGSSVDPNTRRIPVQCVVQNPLHKLKAEMFATFRISSDQETQSPAVPPAAVTQDGDNKVIWVAGQAVNEFQKRIVVTGVEQDGLLQILSGVKPGERVAVQGSLFIGSKGSAD